MNNERRCCPELLVELFRVSNLLDRSGRAITSAAGLSSVHQWYILEELADGRARPLKELGAHTQVTKQNMSSMIERLRQAGFVACRDCGADRRKRLVSITPQGLAALEHIASQGAASHEAALKGFTAEERARLHEDLRRIAANLTTHTTPSP
ncbi:winged helix DNA-binding protein [Paenibacillus sp. IB182496]|uniref:Winged helix DNA-binding protein n=1 Tax=Paenibacillus sabuli TaxID=2772509 RepID=A0A927BQ94_9BACL|nr:MarR family transcriptional regulator [Paenibacillus sabuli]MBD2843770.1 winged helix DNA-binding protein [Paenibacillus sabuli]